MVTGLGRRLLQFPHHQLAGVGRRSASGRGGGCRPACRGGRRGASPRRTRGRSSRSPVPSSGRRGTGCAGPQRGDTWSADGRASRTRLVHHCNANGAAEAMSTVTEPCTPRCTGTSVTDLVGGAAPAAGPDEHLGTRRLDRTDAHPAAGLDAHRHRQAGAAVTGRAAHADPGPRDDHEGPARSR